MPQDALGTGQAAWQYRNVIPIKIPDTSGWDWEIVSYNGSTLVLGAGADLTYGHYALQVTFTDLAYLAMPTLFDNPTFREPTPTEIARVVRAVGEVPPVVVAFDFDGYGGGAYGAGGVSCVIAAEAYDVRTGGTP